MSIYLDHAASTPLNPEVISAIAESLALQGNASSVHTFGQRARQVVEQAREDIARVINADRNEIIFTSGGTESDNLAILGLFEQRNTDSTRPWIVSAATEHHAVIEPVEWLVANRGAQVHWVTVGTDGKFDLAELAAFLNTNHQQVALVTLMWVNNETGVINDIPAIAKLAGGLGVPVHSDAVAALGHIGVDFGNSGLAAMSITGHKLGGPVGTGALVVSRATKLKPLFHGGGHERGMRPGTLDAAGAKAFALAVRLADQGLAGHQENWVALYERLRAGVAEAVPESYLIGADLAVGVDRVANIMDFVFPGCAGDSLLFLLDAKQIAVSNGSACTAGVTSASHVLLNMGLSKRDAAACLRVSFGAQTSIGDIEGLLAALPEAHQRAKAAGFLG